MELVTPCVVKDANAKTAIVVKSGRKYIHVIPMKSGKLTVKRMTPRQYENAGYKVMDVEVKVVVEKYLAHSGGHTDTALKELEGLK